MDIHQAINTFRQYSPREQIDFLVYLAHALTILARDTYEVGTEGITNPSRLRHINELQHRVIGFLLALRRNEAGRYSEDVFVRMLLEHPDDLEFQHQLEEAVNRLMSQLAAAA
jgi:hypothetical protein